jgi:polyisoprenoid-binding protein YceI
MVRVTNRSKLSWLSAALIAAAAVAGSTPAGAEPLTLRLDPAQTEVRFEVEATGHDVEGAFAVQSGEIRFDPATGSASGEIRVDATSAETGNGSRDETMHQEVLESDTYPLFVFHAQRITGELAREGKSQVELHGQLDVHGGTHPITVPTTVEIDGNHLKASATFPVPYVEWGMKRPGFLFLKVAPVVTVSVDAKGSLQEATAAESMATGRTGGR